MKDTILIVGNGLVIDLTKKYGLYKKYDPDHPFDWNIKYRPEFSDGYIKLLNNAKYLNGYILKHRKLIKDIDDYEILEGFLAGFKFIDGPDLLKMVASQMDAYRQKLRLFKQFENYFAIAYSHLQLDIDNIDFKDWYYFQKFDEINTTLIGIVSFNYDLLIERILTSINQKYYRIGVLEENCTGLPLFKPHGSIDFDKSHDYMNLDINSGSLCFNDFPLKLLDKSKWLEPRAQGDIVLPTSHSLNLRYSWTKNGYQWISENFPKANKCIIFGLSYWSCDRPELDYMIDKLDPYCKIIVVNPNPSKQMLVRLYDKFQDVKPMDRM